VLLRRQVGMEARGAMLLLAAVYAHLLLVLDDDDFYTHQTPFTLSQQRAIAATLNSLLYHSLTTASADDQVTLCDSEGETVRTELPSRKHGVDCFFCPAQTLRGLP
jgi:hypothetical protein